jgi:alkylation response protein AidB-like acyl-CoA dehydrogenase
VFIVIASTDARAGYFGLTAFLIAAGQPGLSVSPAAEKMGLDSSPMAEITLDGVFAAQGAVLGSVGGGAAVVQHTLEWELGSLLAPALGTIARLLERTTAHCRARRQFGRPIADFEAVGAQLAELRLRLHLARLAVYEFAWRKDQGLSATLEAAMVKLYVSESLRRAAEVALHLHGAAGYMRALEYEREWRDAMASSLYSGTTEIQLNLIAESLLHAAPAPEPTPATLAGDGEAVAA